MSQVTVEEVKRYLRVTQASDDVLLQELIDAAEQELCRYMNREELPTLPLEYPEEESSEEMPSSNDPVAPDVRIAVITLVKAEYEGQTPEEISKYREAAINKVQPYRVFQGV
jgi:hypothetical protein